MTTRRDFFKQAAAGGIAAASSACVAQTTNGTSTALAPLDSPDPLFEKPAPISMAELANRPTTGVSAMEVNDYAPGRYTGPMTPSPPHADLNPKKAVVISWATNPCKFVFSHEAAYVPILELPNGTGMGNQFFEGNMGNAELFNNMGRKEKNSFVDIVQSGPERAWVRWNYLSVNMKDDTQPRLRGTEDYFAYSNGLILRRASYQSMMPNQVIGYSTQPVELYGLLPERAPFKEFLAPDTHHGDYHTFCVLDLYSDRRYDVYWSETGDIRRSGDNALLAAIAKSPGYALVIPFPDRLLFAVLGEASGFPSKYNELVDHSPGANGANWGQGWWDHWPIGWFNSQGAKRKSGSPYASHFSGIGQHLIPEGKRIKYGMKDYVENVNDMAFNRWTEQRVFYVLLGSAKDWSEIRRLGKTWLDKSTNCARPESIANLT